VASPHLRFTHPRFGIVTLPIRVQEVVKGVVRLLAGRSVPVGSAADLVTRVGVALPGRVSRCSRLPTGLFEVSLAMNGSTPDNPSLVEA
jgi:hypothetical protein